MSSLRSLNQHLARLGFLLGFLACVPGRSFGQQLLNPNRFDFFAGYSYLRLDSQSYGFLNESNLSGANIDLTYRVYGPLSAVLDSSAHFGTNEKFYTFLVGPQYSYDALKGKFFAQALFGKSRNEENIAVPFTQYIFGRIPSSLGRAFALGAGYDRPFSEKITIRVFQADYRQTSTYGTTQNNIRIFAGVVIHLGKKGKK